MHKRFRMIAISNHLQNYTHELEKDKHLRIPGIWKKLDSLYNLEALNERVGDILEDRSPLNTDCHGCRKTLSIRVARRIAAEMTRLTIDLPYPRKNLARRCLRKDSLKNHLFLLILLKVLLHHRQPVHRQPPPEELVRLMIPRVRRIPIIPTSNEP